MSDQELPKEIAEQPTPFSFVMSLAKALESRIDYNFNSIIQMSMLIEYLYIQLEKKGIEIEMEEEFKAFQTERLEELRKEFEAAVTPLKENIDLKDN
jgi:hypothetical protein